MTISLLLPSITGAIDDISVTGVVIKNYNGIVAAWQSQPNVLYMLPDNPITGFSIEFVSLLRGGNAPQDVSYTLNYRFLGSEIGDLSNFSKEYSNSFDKVVLIVNAMMAVPAPVSGKVEMTLGAVTLGPRNDPAGNMYHGADIALNITEMQNA